MLRFAAVLLFVVAVQTRRFSFQNNGRQPLWAGSQGIGNFEPIQDGGWYLRPLTSVSIDVPEGWAGRFWARTGCNFDADGNGQCETGDCGNGLKCNGAGPTPPVTLVEMTLGGGLKCTGAESLSELAKMTLGALDFYDVSNVNGYNLHVHVSAYSQPTNGYYCSGPSCDFGLDIGKKCPSELQVVSNGTVVGCKSACDAFGTDQYCCRGEYASPEKCDPSKWPVNYAKIFHDACPSAYSYAYDSNVNAFPCKNTNYAIYFDTYTSP